MLQLVQIVHQIHLHAVLLVHMQYMDQALPGPVILQPESPV